MDSAECERKRFDSRTEKLDFDLSIDDGFWLSYELVQALFSNCAVAFVRQRLCREPYCSIRNLEEAKYLRRDSAFAVWALARMYVLPRTRQPERPCAMHA